MKWHRPYQKKAFAFLPTRIGDYMYWLVPYIKRVDNDNYITRKLV